MDAREVLGQLVGDAMAPVVALAGHLRGARPFHPGGIVRLADVVAVDVDGAEAALARRLEGHAIVRFSRAWRSGRRLPQLVGAAVRFTRSAKPDDEPHATDQDLLFATLRLGRLSMRALHAGTRFAIDDLGERRLRLVRIAPTNGRPTYRLEARRLHPGARWLAVCDLRLGRRLALDEKQLRFWPFRAGRGVHPIGWLPAIERPVYAASQDADGGVPRR